MLKLNVGEVAYQRHVNQLELARRTKLSRNTIGKYYNGKLLHIDINVVYRIAKALDVKIDDLLIDDGQETPIVEEGKE